MPLVAPQGRRDRRRPARRGEPHRRARERRPRLRRHVPPGRRDPRRDRRGGVRGRGHVRDPAAAEGPERRGAHDRRRMGRGHRRRDHRAPRPRARAAARRPARRASTRSSRRAGAATTRSTSPAARPATRSPRCWRWWPSTRPSTRSSTSGSASSRTRPALMREGRFYPGDGLERIVDYHERQDARFARRGGRDQRRHRQADPHRDRARGRDPRQPGSRRGPRERTALLRVVATRGHRARAPVPLRAVPRPARPRVTAGATVDAPRQPSSVASSAASLRRSLAVVLVVLGLPQPDAAPATATGRDARHAAVVGAPAPAAGDRRGRRAAPPGRARAVAPTGCSPAPPCATTPSAPTSRPPAPNRSRPAAR